MPKIGGNISKNILLIQQYVGTYQGLSRYYPDPKSTIVSIINGLGSVTVFTSGEINILAETINIENWLISKNIDLIIYYSWSYSVYSRPLNSVVIHQIIQWLTDTKKSIYILDNGGTDFSGIGYTVKSHSIVAPGAQIIDSDITKSVYNIDVHDFSVEGGYYFVINSNNLFPIVLEKSDIITYSNHTLVIGGSVNGGKVCIINPIITMDTELASTGYDNSQLVFNIFNWLLNQPINVPETNYDIKNLETIKTNLNNEINNLTQQKNQLLTEINSLSNMTESEINNLPQVKSIISQAKSLLTQVNTLQNDKSSLQSQINSLQSDKNTLQSQVTSLQNDKNNLQSQFTSLQNDKNSLQSQINTNTNMLIGLGGVAFLLLITTIFFYTKKSKR